MIEVPYYNETGERLGSVQLDEAKLGGEVRPALLKQAFVRGHANRRSINSPTKSRADVQGSTRKLYKQKGTGNARRGDKKANLLRGGGSAKAKIKHDWRQEMPRKMRRLANRNALLAKAVDGEIKLVDVPASGAPSTKSFIALMEALGVDRTCLVALADTRTVEAKSARNIPGVTVTQSEQLDVFELLNHRYLVMHKDAFEAYLAKFVNDEKPATSKTDKLVEGLDARTHSFSSQTTEAA
ncbi:50S ribosomal protein L4 [Phycisphaera mikurensis]|uniref:Large ribosomal subunit protein uL4 n=1 Tax=Phycisphaera mikurensis (strain NBRC 102666 / KCTC 22515 / FYK2301M01) TaxID=1142394 RepID=I0III8_PHYMF|nr:50S ribosomal protein L4 [Phycisphaera mikurensis]MBB6442768.1 large subunit ribosomal protein L4 [Phycisphaera mikurensis]BAM05076.1 50S ribosomal protein L4 [Phycisphaera mikurensis NBRC 102666]